MRRLTVLVASFGLLAARGGHAQPAPDAGPAAPDAGVPTPPIPDASTVLPDAAAPSPDAPPAPAAPDAAVPEAGPAATVIPRHSPGNDTAWLLVGGALTFVTVGTVLAYAANSSETDLEDLYVSNNGEPPKFDSKTKARYDDLIAQGRRYEHLSWASFGIAGGMAIAATIFFYRDRRHTEPSVTPVVTTNSAGVSIRF